VTCYRVNFTFYNVFYTRYLLYGEFVIYMVALKPVFLRVILFPPLFVSLRHCSVFITYLSPSLYKLQTENSFNSNVCSTYYAPFICRANADCITVSLGGS